MQLCTCAEQHRAGPCMCVNIIHVWNPYFNLQIEHCGSTWDAKDVVDVFVLQRPVWNRAESGAAVHLQMCVRQKESKAAPHKQVAGLHRPAQQRHASLPLSSASLAKHSLGACLAPHAPVLTTAVYTKTADKLLLIVPSGACVHLGFFAEGGQTPTAKRT